MPDEGQNQGGVHRRGKIHESTDEDRHNTIRDVLEYLTVQGILRWHKEMDGARADVFLWVEDDDGNTVVSLNSSPFTSEDVGGDEGEVIGFRTRSRRKPTVSSWMRLKYAPSKSVGRN